MANETDVVVDQALAQMERLDRLMEIIYAVSEGKSIDEASDESLSSLQSSLLHVWEQNFNKQFPTDMTDEALAQHILKSFIN